MLFTKAFVAAAVALSATAHPLSSTYETLSKRATESVHLVCKEWNWDSSALATELCDSREC